MLIFLTNEQRQTNILCDTTIRVERQDFAAHKCEEFIFTVNSRYNGHPRDRRLVSVIARVRNSGVRK